MRAIAAAMVAVLLVGGVIILRAETMSTHVDGRPGSRTEVVVRAATNNAEPSARERELAYALVVTCHLEVDAELGGPSLRDVAAHAYGFSLTPALDESDERQLVGCLEDIRIDHLQIDVTPLERFPPPVAAP